nr:putative RNA-directed DNA polymerase, eukaryota, reverse transcriptase zinc-binding domain protein [Tanacetum cinerariifolium]
MDDPIKSIDNNGKLNKERMATMSQPRPITMWISSCLSSASVSVLINGSPSKEFKMERGLRQGDPLSPSLLLIVAEALQVMIIEACNKGIFKGLSLGDDGSNISLLQFANDALFFSEWSKSNVRHLILILDCFHGILGLKINLDKSILFGIGVSPEEVSSIARSINCSHGSLLLHP